MVRWGIATDSLFWHNRAPVLISGATTGPLLVLSGLCPGTRPALCIRNANLKVARPYPL